MSDNIISDEKKRFEAKLSRNLNRPHLDYPSLEWINVKEKIPNDDRRVLGTDGKKHEIVCCINSDCEWVGATSDYGHLMILKQVTHWMELPVTIMCD